MITTAHGLSIQVNKTLTARSRDDVQLSYCCDDFLIALHV